MTRVFLVVTTSSRVSSQVSRRNTFLAAFCSRNNCGMEERVIRIPWDIDRKTGSARAAKLTSTSEMPSSFSLITARCQVSSWRVYA
ncbi:hypothetical protein CDEST_14025 [Colletotrichum destructivum]|uniref:Secreted protein n=1 Tax=Colletotrichum destructivum TaxID=34406 RepID=A0AAX4J0N2_9PEZI|nr:hypothetical protein CDEST_14025 [Colletotrichum destructivum]